MKFRLYAEVADPQPSLIKRLGYQFTDAGMLEQALTHRSAGRLNNERLEYLGDALLGAYIAEELFRRFPESDEGQLTRLRSQLVRKESLADLARDLDLGSSIKLGGGELKSGGWRRDSILSNTVEALIGAIFLDSDNTTCRAWVLDLYSDKLQQSSPLTTEKDAKTRLQEYLQGRGMPLPIYETLKVDGPPHNRIFTVKCLIDGMDETGEAIANSRRRAEQAAADDVLKQILI